MQRREPHTIHFQEYENLERICHRLLGNDQFAICFERLEYYMNRYGYIDERKDLVIFRRQHSDIVKERIRETESKEVIDRNAKKLTYGLLDFIASLKPRDYSSYIDGSLRRLSKWDEQENLTIFIQFDPDFDKIDLLSVVSGSN